MLHLEYLIRSRLMAYAGAQGQIYIHASEQINSNNTMEYMGSCAEQLRLYIRHTSLVKTCCNIMSSRKVTSATISEGSFVRGPEEDMGSHYDLRADTSKSPTGYLRMLPISPQMWHPFLSVMSDGKTYLSHPSGGLQNCRKFFGLRCLKWPDISLEWVSRHRPSNWPGQQAIQSSVAEGCLVISRAHPLSRFPDVEWQYVFPCAERILALDALTVDMRDCFWVFKSLVDYYLLKASARLTTTHLKTVLYFACETISVDLWKDNRPGCLLYLLNMLLRYLKSRCLPNYFIIGNNMLDGFTDQQLAFFTTTVQTLLSFPLIAITFMADHYGYRSTDLIDHLLEDAVVFRREFDIERTVNGLILPELMQRFATYLFSRLYDLAAHILHDAYFFVEIEHTTSNKRKLITFQDFVIQNLKTECREDIYRVSVCLDKIFKTNLLEFYKFDIKTETCPDTSSSPVCLEDTTSLLMPDKESLVCEASSETTYKNSGTVNEEASHKEKKTARKEECRLRHLLGATKAGRFADEILPAKAANSIILQSEFLLKLGYDLYHKTEYQYCVHIATCAIDLIKKHQAGQLDSSSIEDPMLKKEVEEQRAETVICLKSNLLKFHGILFICYSLLGTIHLFEIYKEDFRELVSSVPNTTDVLEDLQKQLGLNLDRAFLEMS